MKVRLIRSNRKNRQSKRYFSRCRFTGSSKALIAEKDQKSTPDRLLYFFQESSTHPENFQIIQAYPRSKHCSLRARLLGEFPKLFTTHKTSQDG